MNNSFLNPYNTVNLTGLIDITANVIKLISINENDEEQITNILDLFVQFNSISTVIDVTYPLGGGLTYTVKEWNQPISDTRVPGLQSLISYLDTNFRRIYDDSIINNYYNITKIINNITKQETFNYHKHQNITHKYYTQHINKNDTYTYRKNITNRNITHKTLPNYIHTENNYTYIKHNNTTLLNQIQNLQNQINDLQTQINNLP